MGDGRGLGRGCDRTPRDAGNGRGIRRLYDRHLDPAWEEVLLAPADAGGKRVPWAYVAPKGVEDLIGMGGPSRKRRFERRNITTRRPTAI